MTELNGRRMREIMVEVTAGVVARSDDTPEEARLRARLVREVRAIAAKGGIVDPGNAVS